MYSRSTNISRFSVLTQTIHSPSQTTPTLIEASFVCRQKLRHDQNPLVKRIREMEDRKSRRRRQSQQDTDHEIGQVQGRGHHDGCDHVDAETPNPESYRSDSGCFSRINTPYTESYIVHPEWVGAKHLKYMRYVKYKPIKPTLL